MANNLTTIYPVIPPIYNLGGVRSMHPDLVQNMYKYQLVYDVMQGSNWIKSKGQTYLPKPNSTDTSQENAARYRSYLTRAVFYNVTGNTCSGLVGQIFSQEPSLQLPDELSVLGLDDNGKFITLQQVAKQLANNAVPYGRTGILVDYPLTEGVVTADVSKQYKPTFKVYYPWDIINWIISNINNVATLTRVVLREKLVITGDDGFQLSYGERYRVLSLIEGVYVQDIYESPTVGGELKLVGSFIPLDHTGMPFDFITFKFIGSENNDQEIDKVPLYDLAEVNVGHYRNSADYEEGVFLCGQPTLVINGLTKDWVSTIFKDQAIMLGSTAAIPLPQNADAKLIVAPSNSVGKEAMDTKEKQMIALGAKLIERQVQRTAFETALDKAGEVSILANIAMNISAAFTQALKIAAMFVGGDAESIQFSLTNNFSFITLNNQDRLALIAEYQAGEISFSEVRNVLRRGGIVTQTDDKAKIEIKENPAMQIQGHSPAGDVKSDNGAVE